VSNNLSTSGCGTGLPIQNVRASVAIGGGGRACDRVLRLRQAEAAAQRRAQLDAEIRGLEARLGQMPAVGQADTTEMPAELLSWATRGALAPSPRDIYRLGLAIALSLAGITLAFAKALI
jgi:hypothetical protein